MFVETTENWMPRVYPSKYLWSILMCWNCSEHNFFHFHWKDCLHWYPPILYIESIDYKLWRGKCMLWIYPQTPVLVLNGIFQMISLSLSHSITLFLPLHLSLYEIIFDCLFINIFMNINKNICRKRWLYSSTKLYSP